MTTPDDFVDIDLSEGIATSEEMPPELKIDDWDEPEPEIAPYTAGTTTWAELDVDALLEGSLEEAPPILGQRNDGPALLYPGKVNGIMGEPESGKGWFAMRCALDAFEQGRHVLYIDFEDGPKGVLGRLRALGVPNGRIKRLFHYIHPGEKLDPKIGMVSTGADLRTAINRLVHSDGGLGLIVFDGITEALALQGTESKDNDKVAEWFGAIPRRLAHATGAAVLLIDHVTKSVDNRGRYAIGAQAKLSAIDGAQFTADVRKVFARARSGLVRIEVTKDRPGYVREHGVRESHKQAIADLVITARPDGGVLLTLAPPDIQTTADGKVKPTALEAKMLGYLKRCKGQSRSKQEIMDQAPARATTQRLAFTNLKDMGAIVEVKNGRKTEYRLGTPKDQD